MLSIRLSYWFAKHFITQHPIYLACSLIYYLAAVWMCGWKWWGFAFFAIIYVLSLGVAFSSLGEKLMRLFNNVRRLETAKEKEYLHPLFQEVCDKAKTKNSKLWNVDICIIDSMAVNACAIGRYTIAVTKGAMHTFSEDELKAVLAHEISHIHHMDTISLIYATIGNGIFSAVVVLFKMIGWLFGFLWNRNRGPNFFTIILDAVVFVFLALMNIVMAVSDREAERRADAYTITLGYGEEMVSALYLLEKISLNGDRSIIERLLSSHPRVTARIERLEIKLGVQ